VHDKSLLKASPLLLRCLENFIQWNILPFFFSFPAHSSITRMSGR
jgi:hypothetical protein